MTVHLCQCLCERRHCMIAGAFDDADTTIEEGERQTREQFEQMTGAGGALKARCRICGSETFHYETGRTAFRSMAEAQPVLADVQAVNIATGDVLELAAGHQPP